MHVSTIYLHGMYVCIAFLQVLRTKGASAYFDIPPPCGYELLMVKILRDKDI